MPALAIALAAALCCGAAPAAADPDSPLKAAAKALGFATDVGPPADFVAASRPPGELDYIPIYAPPAEPPHPALDAKAQKALADDLEATRKRNEALRAGFSPASKSGEKPIAEFRKPQKRKAAPIPERSAPAQ